GCGPRVRPRHLARRYCCFSAPAGVGSRGSGGGMMDDALLERFRRGDRTALARMLTLAARGELDSSLVLGPSSLEPSAKTQDQSTKNEARVVAMTGSGGVGKSTLVGKLIEHIRKQNLKVAVLACDPQSPLTGGALLGDRFRMPTVPDDGVFIRSLAA